MPARTLDDALAERDKLLRNYKVAKRKRFDELCEDVEHGVKLRKFRASLAHFKLDGADRMIEFVTAEQRRWLRHASLEIRYAALEAISARIVSIREKAGLEPFSDPLPDQDDDVFQICKNLLELR